MGSVEYRQISYFLFIITIKIARSNNSIIPRTVKRKSFGLDSSPESAFGFIVVGTVLDVAITVLVVVSTIVLVDVVLVPGVVVELVSGRVVLELLVLETVVLELLVVLVDSPEGSVVLELLEVVVESSEMLKSIFTMSPAFHWAVWSMGIPST